MASIQPEETVYSGPKSAPPRRVTLRTLRQMYAKNEPISMVTAYDYPSAVHVSNCSFQPMPMAVVISILSPTSCFGSQSFPPSLHLAAIISIM